MKTLLINGHEFRCRLALTESEHRIGLSKTASLPPDEGLLFVFDRVASRTFHMSDVSFPIDIVGLSQNSTVVKIAHQCQPGSLQRWTFPHVAAVVELPGGTCRKLALHPGMVIETLATKVAGDGPVDEAFLQKLEREWMAGKSSRDTLNDIEALLRYQDIRRDIKRELEYIADELRDLIRQEEPDPSAVEKPLDMGIGSADSSLETAPSPPKRPSLPYSKQRARSATKQAQIVDEEKFVQKVSRILATHANDMQWMPDQLNGGKTERVVVNRSMLARWLGGDAEPAATKYILTAAGTEQGLDLVGDAFILGGLADIARLGYSNKQPTLVLYRDTQKLA